MSGHEDELRRVATSSTERGKARRFLLGSCLALPGIGLAQWTEDGPFQWLAWALCLPGLVLMLSQPKDSGILIIPKNLRRMAHLAGVPELGTIVVVYTCVVGGFTSATVGFLVFITTT
jgi:hypothetical protein